jgi:shikimate kinase
VIGTSVDTASSVNTAEGDEVFVAIIVGLPGVGKSTIGRRVARRLGWDFVDLDAAIESSTGRSVRDIFETEGEDGFRDIESQSLRESIERTTPCIVATGGGVVLRDSNRALLRNVSAVLWMTAGLGDLEKRLEPRSGTGRGHRPLLDGDTRAALERLAAERSSLYAEVATDVLDTAGSTFDAVVDRMLEVIATHTATIASERPGNRPSQSSQDADSAQRRKD